ncbi:hypothetical protein WJX84_006040 [Apatococcus fuscideae]|uniref:MATH domain-containing protein n=1 Tax=Apatococcus fuscideae TaxID=2026836 RepID=A0AAW1TCW9_9CHLO
MQVNCGHEWRFHFDTMHLKSQGSDTKGNVFSSAFVLDGMSWKLVLRFPWEDRIGSSLDVYLMSSDVDHVDAYFAVNIEFLHPLGRANNIKQGFRHLYTNDQPANVRGACLFRSSFGYNTTMLAGLAAMMVAWRWIMAGLSSSIPSLFEWHLEPSSDRRRLIQSLCTCHFVSLIVYTWAMQIVPVPWQRWAWGAWGLLVSSRQTSRTFTHIRAKSGKPPSTYASLLLVHHGLYVSCIVAGCDGLFFWLLSGIVAIAAVEGYLWSLSPIVKAAAWTFHVYRLWTALHLSATTALSYDASDDPHPDFGYIRSQMEVDIMSRCLPDILLLMTCMSSWKEAILDSVFMTRMD